MTPGEAGFHMAAADDLITHGREQVDHFAQAELSSPSDVENFRAGRSLAARGMKRAMEILSAYDRKDLSYDAIGMLKAAIVLVRNARNMLSLTSEN